MALTWQPGNPPPTIQIHHQLVDCPLLVYQRVIFTVDIFLPKYKLAGFASLILLMVNNSSGYTMLQLDAIGVVKSSCSQWAESLFHGHRFMRVFCM